jgi:hypothetical protein
MRAVVLESIATVYLTIITLPGLENDNPDCRFVVLSARNCGSSQVTGTAHPRLSLDPHARILDPGS